MKKQAHKLSRSDFRKHDQHQQKKNQLKIKI